jgi:hypothetical protein
MGRSFFSWTTHHLLIASINHDLPILNPARFCSEPHCPPRRSRLLINQLKLRFCNLHQPKVSLIACTLNRVAGTTSAKPFITIYQTQESINFIDRPPPKVIYNESWLSRNSTLCQAKLSIRINQSLSLWNDCHKNQQGCSKSSNQASQYQPEHAPLLFLSANNDQRKWQIQICILITGHFEYLPISLQIDVSTVRNGPTSFFAVN